MSDVPRQTGGSGPDLAAMRVRYVPGPLHEADVTAEPAEQFRRWLADAVTAGLPEPNAMVLATSTVQGRASTRVVLLKELDDRGFVFYTNTGSRKAAEIEANPRASLCFPWFPMARQVLVEGPVEPVARDVAHAYWATRPRESQLGAWASAQSEPIDSREALAARLTQVSERFGDGPVPLPQRWGGYRVVPEVVEFWQGQPGRLHDRLRYRLAAGAWTLDRLQP